MAYQKQGFADGDTLFAKHLEHIEQGIIDHEKNVENPHKVTAQQVRARPDDWIPTAAEVGAATLQDVNAQVKKAAPRNLLDNSDWRVKELIVNQRGQDSYSGIGDRVVYTIDRWAFSWQDGATLTVGEGYIQKDEYKLTQWIENVDATKLHTGVVCLADGTKHIYSGKPSIGFGEWDRTIWVSVDGNMVSFRIESGLTQPMVWAALYEGEYTIDTLPEYQPKGYGAELAECQRYYRSYNLGINDALCFGMVRNTAEIRAIFMFPSPLREINTANKIPTIELEGTLKAFSPEADSDTIFANKPTVKTLIKDGDGNIQGMQIAWSYSNSAISPGQNVLVLASTACFLSFSVDV